MPEAEATPEEQWVETGRGARGALAETWASLAGVGRDLGPEEWERPTACPGWSVKDQFSHLIGIERLLLGEAAPAWDEPLGDHVKNDFAATNEPWIAVRRAWSPESVLDEFAAVTARRLAALDGLSGEAWSAVGFSPIGQVPYARFMVTRVFDSWVHEQDVRQATARAGGTGGVSSSLALDQVQSAMGFVVGKKAAAPEGSVVRFSVTGPPGDARQFSIGVRDGRAGPVPPDEAATVTLTLSQVDFTRLGCGRATAEEVESAGGVGVAGDAALAQSILTSMAFTF